MKKIIKKNEKESVFYIIKNTNAIYYTRTKRKIKKYY